MKRIIMPNRLAQIDLLSSFCDGFLLSIDGLSVNAPWYVSFEETKKIIQGLKKEIFLSLNKNMHPKDLVVLEEVLKECSTLPIKGIFYYDVAVVNINKRLSLGLSLIWAQEHMTTNSDTCKYWQTHGVKGIYLSPELMKEELLQIASTTDMNLFVSLFGYLPMFTSKRHLIDNYEAIFALEKKNSQYFLSKEGKKYPIIDESVGTTVYSDFVFSAFEETVDYNKAGIGYGIINTMLLDDEVIKTVLTKPYSGKGMKAMGVPIGTGFLYKPTVYKVKDYE